MFTADCRIPLANLKTSKMLLNFPSALAVNPGLKKGFRWEAPYITQANLRTSIGVNCDQLWQNNHCNGLCVDYPFTSRCSTALLWHWGNSGKRGEDTRHNSKHHIYLVRIDHRESKRWQLAVCVCVSTPQFKVKLGHFRPSWKHPKTSRLPLLYCCRKQFTLVNPPQTNTSETTHIHFPWTAFMTEESSALTRSCSARKTLQQLQTHWSHKGYNKFVIEILIRRGDYKKNMVVGDLKKPGGPYW